MRTKKVTAHEVIHVDFHMMKVVAVVVAVVAEVEVVPECVTLIRRVTVSGEILAGSLT